MSFDLVHANGDAPIGINTMSFNFTGTGSIVNDLENIYFYTSENGNPVYGHASEGGVSFSEFEKIELDPGEKISITVGAYLKADAKVGYTYSLSVYDFNAFIMDPEASNSMLSMKENTSGLPLQSSVMTVASIEEAQAL